LNDTLLKYDVSKTDRPTLKIKVESNEFIESVVFHITPELITKQFYQTNLGDFTIEDFKSAVDEFRKNIIWAIGEKYGWRKTKMEKQFGVNRKTIYSWIKEFYPEKIKKDGE